MEGEIFPGRRRVPTKRLRIIEELKAAGVSNRQIAARLGVTEKAIRKAVGPSEQRMRQEALPLDSAQDSGGTAPAIPAVKPEAEQRAATPSLVGQVSSLLSPQEKAATAAAPGPAAAAPAAMSLDRDPTNRVWDRLLACGGLLDDAAPIFSNSQAVPGAGALEKAHAARAFGADYIANILRQQQTPREVQPPVRLRQPELNELATDPLSLAGYDAFILESRKEAHDLPPSEAESTQPDDDEPAARSDDRRGGE